METDERDDQMPGTDTEERERSALGGRKGDDGLIGATGADVGGNAGSGMLGDATEADVDDAAAGTA